MVAVGRHADHDLRVAREHGLGVEMQVFANPAVLDDDYRVLVRKMAKRLARLEGPIGYHGPYIDTIHFSYDREIMEASRRRYLQAMDIAEELGARFVLFHSQYNPLIKLQTYPEIYHSQSLKFWPGLLVEAEKRNLPIYLENMFDDSPDPLVRLLNALDTPWLRLCLDPAHSMLHSPLAREAWIQAFAPRLAHLHLSDCHGVFDDHLPVGHGVVEWDEILWDVVKRGIPVTYALETGKGTRPSLKHLGIAKK